jgi:Tfp pilus assembly protein PilV
VQITCSKKGTLSKAGFGLTESLIGVLVMGTVFVALYAGMATGFQSVRSARENLRATQILLEKFETIRLYNWEQITATNFIPTAFTNTYTPNNVTKGIEYVGRVTISTNLPLTDIYREDMRSVTISVSWNSNGAAKSRTFTSFVARYGLQHYIY